MKYLAVMVLSEHDTEEDAIMAMLDAMNAESDALKNKDIKELREQGIDAISAKEAIKGMSYEQRERFLDERNKKFVNPILNMNIKLLKENEKRHKLDNKKGVHNNEYDSF